MAIRNLMEDMVTGIVEEVLVMKANDNNDVIKNINKDDIITYVLNRIPPKYYTSERGILHGKLESEVMFQQKTDILILIHEAIKTVQKRRESELHIAKNKIKKELFFPHVLGEVLENTTFSIVSDVNVTLFCNDKPAVMIDESWKNPYITNKATKGFFHFWPKPEAEEKAIEDINFKIVCRHPKFKENSIEFTLQAVDDRNFYKSHVLPMILLQSQEGEDISFLDD
ncbi:MAG: late competence development ComFB family protein [Spirochaetes bacterium]|nr:late competence development ComFB family protein [Spirochaetota bacterium]